VRYCPKCFSIYTAQVEHCGIDGTRLAESDSDPLIGRTLDRYLVEARIGLGANGAVYQVVHRYLGSRYAMKVLFGDLGANRRVVERFRREAQAVSVMRHPNIVSVTDFGTTSNGLTFLVMELLRGETLNNLLLRGPLGPARAIHVARQVAAALGEAHRLGYVHRDVKPANVMVDGPPGQEVVKLLDFGVVGHSVASRDARITGVGQFVGTPLYMAPEQAREPERVRAVSDLYALGVILFEMLAGRPPFDAEGVVDLLILHRQAPVPALPPCGGLERVVRGLLEKAPEARPQSAEEVIRELERLPVAPERGISITLSDVPAPSPDTLEMALDERTPYPFAQPDSEPPRSTSPLPGVLAGLELTYDFLHGRLDRLEDRVLGAIPSPDPTLLERVGALRAALHPELSRDEADALAARIDDLTDQLASR
jgi:serine/threonine protein kinase